MHTEFTPLLSTTDWNAEWIELQKIRKKADDADFWDDRAKTFPTAHGSQSPYAGRFLGLAKIEPGETVLDMGCGTGILATPLAESGVHVIAADFSQGMLDVMAADQAKRGITNVESKKMGWSDNWNDFGLGENSVDVAIASRSIATNDMRASLERLNTAARRRVCLTLPSGSSPRTDARLLEAVGLQARTGRDFVYVFNILVNMGILPEVEYIPTSRYETFESFEDARSSLGKMIRDATQGFTAESDLDAAGKRLDAWLENNLVENENAGCTDRRGNKEKALRLREKRIVTWAFLAWNK